MVQRLAPMHAGDALHLLWVYESIIATRPLSRGNREFLGMLLASARAIAAYLDRVQPFGKLNDVVETVRRQTLDDAVAQARKILNSIRHVRGEQDPRGTRTLYLRRPLPALRTSYGRIAVVFGPGLGMGDEITFLHLLRRLSARFPDAALSVFNLYPGLWSQLIPRVTEVQYRGKPLRPFVDLAMGGTEAGPLLVIVVDFDCYYFHENGLPRRNDQDVVEISLGLRKAWASRGASPWVDVEEFPQHVSNYATVAAMTDRLLGPAPDEPIWAPVVTRTRAYGSVMNVLLNPHSSKPVPLDAARWVSLFDSLARSLRGRTLEVTVLPGLEETSRADSATIVDALAASGIQARLFKPGRGDTTPYNAIPLLTSALWQFDLCITIDTYTAHLVPLFDVPTLVIALKRNSPFWVPAPRVIHLTTATIDHELAPVVARLVGHKAIPPARSASASALVRAVDEACRQADAEAFERIYAALSQYHATMEARGERAEGTRWLRFWSRAMGAARREPVAAELLAPYPRLFADTVFCKLAMLDG